MLSFTKRYLRLTTAQFILSMHAKIHNFKTETNVVRIAHVLDSRARISAVETFLIPVNDITFQSLI